MSTVLFFVPSVKVSVGGFLGTGGEVRSLSSLDGVRVIFQSDRPGLGFLFTLMFCVTAAFALLGVMYPRRWVFVAGPCYMIFGLVLDFFSGPNPSVEYYFLPRLLGYIALTMTITGFWIKPPALGVTTARSAPS
jgi:hypothetical protein